jgi:hypothetical protein
MLLIKNYQINQKCNNLCQCGSSKVCINCNNTDNFIGYDEIGQSLKYALVSSTAPNTNGVECQNSNIEIQVKLNIVFRIFKSFVQVRKKVL